MLVLFAKLSNTQKSLFFVAENPPGICQHQTELIALNLSRNLKVSGHDDVIIGVTEVAWESSEIRSLTSLCAALYPICLINHAFRLISSTVGLTWEKAAGLRCSLRGPYIGVVCVCVHEDSPKPCFGVVRGGSGGGWLRGMKRWEAGVGDEAG